MSNCLEPTAFSNLLSKRFALNTFFKGKIIVLYCFYSDDIHFQINRASTLMNICPYKEKLKEGQKNGQNGKIKHCSEYVI